MPEPLSIGKILGNSVSFFGKNLLPLMGISSLLALLALPIGPFMQLGSDPDPDDPVAVVVTVIITFVSFLMTALLTPAVCAHLDGVPMTVFESARRVAARFLPVILLAILVVLSFIVPLALGITLLTPMLELTAFGCIFGIVFLFAAITASAAVFCGLIVAQPALIMRDLSVVEACKYSWWLTENRRRSVFGLLVIQSFLLGPPLALAQMSATGLASISGAGASTGEFLILTLQALGLLFGAVVVNVLFHRLETLKAELGEVAIKALKMPDKIAQAPVSHLLILALVVIALGLGLVYFRASREEPVDVAAIVEALLQQQRQGEAREQADWEQIEALTKTVKSLAAQSGNQDAPEGLNEALNELAEGRTDAAKALLQWVAAEQEALGQAAVEQAAETYRHLGALAFLEDTDMALSAYRKATELHPENLEAWDRLGHLLLRTGELYEAEYAFATVTGVAQSRDDYGWEAKGLDHLGDIYFERGEVDKAFNVYKKALARNKEIGRKEGMADNYGHLGNVYKSRGQLHLAVDKYESCLALVERLGDKEGMAKASGILGWVYHSRGELDRAVQMYERALVLDEELGRKDRMATSYGNLAAAYLQQGDLDRSVKISEKARSLNEELGRKEHLAANYSNLGGVYMVQGDLDRAEEMHEKALALTEELGLKGGMASNYGKLGNVYFTRGEPARAEDAWRTARELYAEIGAPQMVEQMEARLAKLPDSG